ncbi:hypothetical protein BDR07DRAFT_1502110 [Suillus spraguei]|nr:hypothetical protein BDR07DRAFT_1502110 [Suillus spraguei]
MGSAQHDAGEDLPWDERADYPPDLEEEQECSVILTKHWNQFCSDLLQKCGNLRNQLLMASHCRLTMEEHQNVTDKVYKDINLAMVFHRVQWKKVSGQEWKEVFDIFFPPLSAELRMQPQNYPGMKYWNDWHGMKSRLPHADIMTIRNKYWKLFKELFWIPKPHKDWLCTQAPQVIVSPASYAPRWELERVPRVVYEVEEEEEETEVDCREWEEEEESGSDADI